jgi:hypothetical protein
MRVQLLALVLPLLAGCSATHTSDFLTTGSGAGGGPSGSVTATAAGSGGDGGGIHFGTGGSGNGGAGGAPQESEVFAQSAGTLYRLDPTTKVVTTVGGFNGCSNVIDIAVDKNGVMFATTSSGLYRVDKTTAACTHIRDGGYPNSLSFVPEGTVDPSDEALVGYNGGTYVRIDTATGAVTNIGALGGGYASSGDIVSVIGGGTYLTVIGGSCDDCIVEVNPKTGALVKLIGPLGHASVYGLAFWAGSAYGFDDGGELFQIDLTSGATTTIAIPNAPPGLSFYGAGSTTSAPLKPPN